MRLPVELTWQVCATTGWGLFSLHLALGLKREGWDVRLVGDFDPTGIPKTLLPTLEDMRALGDRSERRIRIAGLGNHFPGPDHVPNRLHVALAVFEDTHIPEAGLERIKRFDHHIACSTWAQGILNGYGIPSHRWFQGYDDTLFTPSGRRRPKEPDRFYVFSGGKLEFRKGQDIVIEAFKRFRETPEGKDAVLVTAWQNKWPQTMVDIWASGYVKGIPVTRMGEQDIPAWLEANGIPRSAVLDVGMRPQPDLANLLRECDVALMPNRCEGATNMILPEVMASGVPVIASENTGHLDSGPCPFVLCLHQQSPVTLRCKLFEGYEGWGESDIEECVSHLQVARTTTDRRGFTSMAAQRTQEAFSWTRQAKRLSDYLDTIT